MSPTEQRFVDRGSDRLALHHYPSPSPTAPVAVVLPAMGAAARFYRPLAESLGAAGFEVVVADLRGTGDSTPRPSRSSRYGYTDLAGDVGAVLDELKADDRRIVLVGHSLGGQAGLLHLATAPGAPVDGIALVAAAIPYWRSYPRHGQVIRAYTQAIGAVASVLGFWPGWTFGGRQASGVMRDWARSARTGAFPGADAAMTEVTTPVLAVSIDDDVYTPHEAVDHTTAKLRRATVRRERIARIEAEGRPAHFAWVRAPEPVTTLIRDWFDTLPPHR
ncbi:Predicted alpha/beta hydrolase [Asanoa hainanensis]|uniref:Predicted alpha/beta hydrolase n=1 Tax=Asanoa hainanensis TaxID=560556 RepID=A0A239NDU1_9ACTN|nr:alpha/beta fold hydrolase [Asanoa hainanensis]SNT52309.1 Predicted alpha/beta hydrolase [Asanoa hainanensis]